ncbi:MAG TPA: hypothetical protein PKA27_11675 [Fimbriimonadaceae bacterium]|nr:hypothetical protein [Fimbriimonadaceae bacterium]
MDTKTVLAIDPGSSKCGLALVRRETSASLTLVWNRVCPTDAVSEAISGLREEHPISLVIVGSGTASRPLVDTIRKDHPGMGILIVDEKDTTLQARERYWEYHPRRGWRRLLPASVQLPPVPYDDFAALILAERVLAQ